VCKGRGKRGQWLVERAVETEVGEVHRVEVVERHRKRWFGGEGIGVNESHVAVEHGGVEGGGGLSDFEVV
jgi:hypothetical protein